MKKIVVLVCALIVLQQLDAQTYKDSIRTQFLRYNTLLQQKQLAKSMDYLNPGLYALIAKEQVLAMMEQTFNNPDVEFNFGVPQIGSVEDSVRIENMTYARFHYTGLLSIRFMQQGEKKQDTALTRAALANQFGGENVKYDAATGYYHVNVDKKVVANSTDSKRWTFVVVEDRQRAMLEKFIPKELL